MVLIFNELEVKSNTIFKITKNNKIEIRINDESVFIGNIKSINAHLEIITDIKEKIDFAINNLPEDRKMEFVLNIDREK